MNILKYFIIVICLYAYLHNPLLKPLGGVGLCKVLYLLSLVYIISDINSFKRTLRLFKAEFNIMTLLLVFVLIRSLVGGDPVILYIKIVLLIECFVIPIAFVTYWYKNNYTFEKLVTCILIVSSIAAFVTTACVMNPSFGSFIRNELQKSSEYVLSQEYRGFGISDSLTSSYGYIQGACFVLAYKYFKTNKWVALFMPFMLFSSFINARTGLIVAVVGMLIILWSTRSLKTGLGLGAFIAVLLFFVPYFIDIINPSERSVEFMTDFFEQMTQPGENETVTSLNEGFKWPSDALEWIMGKGVDIFQLQSGKRSDVGYSIQLNYGGLLYLFILYGLILKMVRKLLILRFDAFYPLFIFVSLALLNYKANIFNNSGYFRMMMLLYVFIVVLNNKNNLHYNKR